MLYSPRLTSDTYIIQLWRQGYCRRIAGADDISQKHGRGRRAAQRNKMWRWGPHPAPVEIGEVAMRFYTPWLTPHDSAVYVVSHSIVLQGSYEETFGKERIYHDNFYSIESHVHHVVKPHIQGRNALLTHALGGPATASNSSSYWSRPGPDICAAPRSGERQIEIEFDNPHLIQQLVRVFTCVRECGAP
ncbi:hypothetical protein BGW80DRAFT_1248689 [Lactifluus volemus]|nr:hypothetical protein BGW80DRAFT_1248689 [Lactifluus volemus]